MLILRLKRHKIVFNATLLYSPDSAFKVKLIKRNGLMNDNPGMMKASVHE